MAPPGRGAAPVRHRELAADGHPGVYTSRPRAPRRRQAGREGRNNKRGKAERGRADTHVTALTGGRGRDRRAAGRPPPPQERWRSEEGRRAGRADRRVDRGGAYAQGPARRERTARVTYRRAPLAVPASPGHHYYHDAGGGGRHRAEETVTEGLRPGRQPPSERGKVACRPTSDPTCPADTGRRNRGGGRRPQDASENYGTTRAATTAPAEANTKIAGNPARRPQQPKYARRKRRWPPPSAT